MRVVTSASLATCGRLGASVWAGADAALVLNVSGRALGGVAAASNSEGAAAVSLDAGGPVELLQQIMRGQLDLLMAPLHCPVDTGDEGAAV